MKLSSSFPWEKCCLLLMVDATSTNCAIMTQARNARTESTVNLCRIIQGVPFSKCSGCFATHAFERRSSIIAKSTMVTPISKLRPILKLPIIASIFAPRPGIPIKAVSTTMAKDNMITWFTPTRISVRAEGI